MNRFTVVICSVLLVLATACDQTPVETETHSPATTAAAPAATDQATGQATDAPPAAPAQASLAGTTIALADGAQVEIISVGGFDQTYKTLNGTVAIEGRVAEVFPERGAFVLVDYDRMAECQSGCCPQAEVPVRLTLAEFKGELPSAELEIIVIGELALNDLGYELTVNEIRCGSEVLLSRIKSEA